MSLVKNISIMLCLEIDKDIQESGGVFLSFNSLTDHHKNFTLSDFCQEVVFIQYFYLYKEFLFFVCLFVHLSVCLFY